MKYGKISPGLQNKYNTDVTNNQNKFELNLNTELNNKISLECSYLINEIKRKKKPFLFPIKNDLTKLNIHKPILSRNNKNTLITKSSTYSKSEISNLSNLNRFEEYTKNISLPKQLDNNKSISLTSLFNLPKIKLRNRVNISQRVIKNNYFSINLHKKKDMFEKSNQKNNILGLNNFMKEKFYSDVEKVCKNQIKTKYFRNDPVIKNEIIAIKKFGVFWNRFIEYCQPIVKFKKYQLLRNHLYNDKNIKNLGIERSKSVLNIKPNSYIF